MKPTVASYIKRTLIGFLLAVFIGGSLACGQGTFQNLDFESAQVVFTGSDTIATTNALPGWTAFAPVMVGGLTFTQQLNSIPFGYAYPSNYPVALIPAAGSYAAHATIDGNFSLLLNNGFISQTGQVSADVRSLLFKVHSDQFLGNGSVLASLNGQSLSLVALLTVPATTQNISYTLYGADISGFAGQPVDSVFSGTGASGAALLDDIEFSSQPIPEPASVFLILLGAGVFLRRSRPAS